MIDRYSIEVDGVYLEVVADYELEPSQQGGLTDPSWDDHYVCNGIESVLMYFNEEIGIDITKEALNNEALCDLIDKAITEKLENQDI